MGSEHPSSGRRSSILRLAARIMAIVLLVVVVIVVLGTVALAVMGSIGETRISAEGVKSPPQSTSALARPAISSAAHQTTSSIPTSAAPSVDATGKALAAERPIPVSPTRTWPPLETCATLDELARAGTPRCSSSGELVLATCTEAVRRVLASRAAASLDGLCRQ